MYTVKHKMQNALKVTVIIVIIMSLSSSLGLLGFFFLFYTSFNHFQKSTSPFFTATHSIPVSFLMAGHGLSELPSCISDSSPMAALLYL